MKIGRKKIRACTLSVTGSAFAYEREATLPKLHAVGLYIGKRGSGKNVAATALIEKLQFHRIFVITPFESFQSNKQQMDRLGIDEQDVFDCDDCCSVDKIMSAMNTERDEWERWKEDMRRYNKLMKLITSSHPIDSLPAELIYEFYNGEDFTPPKHKYNGARPCCAVMFDDILCSPIMLKGIRKVNSLVIRHRHIAPLKEGGALGISCFFLSQTYKCQVGGISKAIRGQATFLVVFRTKNKNELQEICEECAGEVDEEVFKQAYESAVVDKHDFMFIDFHAKDPSLQFRKGYNEALLIPTDTKCCSTEKTEACGKGH